jgi:hypothetical protein
MRQISPRQWFISFLIALPIAYVWLFLPLLRCQLVGINPAFRAVPTQLGRVFVSHDTPIGQQRQLLTNLKEADNRLKTFWLVPLAEQRQGRATLVYCHTDAQYGRYCGGGEASAGCSLGTPWGQSFLVVGRQGSTADVLAHELCHDELLARLGWWRVQRQIPQWFNEGLALMVDYRFTNPTPDSLQRATDYADEWAFQHLDGQPTLMLDNLSNVRDFFGGNFHRTMQAYMLSATEVSRWLAVAGRPGVRALVRAITDGQDFRETYGQLGTLKKRAKNGRISTN